jgi:uncharacterized glyoxalase superfamily protein PhnB
VYISIYTENARALWARAVAAGADVLFPIGKQFWGSIYGQVRDPSGHVWEISQRVAEPDEEAMRQAFSAE